MSSWPHVTVTCQGRSNSGATANGRVRLSPEIKTPCCFSVHTSRHRDFLWMFDSPIRPHPGPRIQRGPAPVYMLATWRGAGRGPRGELSGHSFTSASEAHFRAPGRSNIDPGRKNSPLEDVGTSRDHRGPHMEKITTSDVRVRRCEFFSPRPQRSRPLPQE